MEIDKIKKKGFYGMMVGNSFKMHCNTEQTTLQEISLLLSMHTAIGKLIRKRLYALFTPTMIKDE